MDVKSLFQFLKKNTDLKGNDSAVHNAVKELSDDSWGDGYNAALRHLKRRKMIAAARRKKSVGRFLDLLSDLTHGKDKKK